MAGVHDGPMSNRAPDLIPIKLDAPAAGAGEHEHTLGEEIAHAVTHGVGALLSLAGLVVLVVAAASGSAAQVLGCTVYGTTLLLLYLASTVYHAWPARLVRVKRVLQRVDHGAIYLLIAGTYTPFCLAVLQGAWGWTLFGIIWGLAVLGVALKSVLYAKWMPLPAPPPLDHLHTAPETARKAPKSLGMVSTAIYLAMGWLIVLAIVPLWRSLSPGGLFWLFAGGACYTLGAAFYLWKSLRFHHAIWHLWVMAGSACHFFAVLWHVIPGRG